MGRLYEIVKMETEEQEKEARQPCAERDGKGRQPEEGQAKEVFSISSYYD